MQFYEFEMFVSKFKEAIEKEYTNSNYESCLNLMRQGCNFFYDVNQFYFDEELELMLNKIVRKLYGEQISYKSKRDIILFYDGFGLNSRGLIQNYLNALSKIGKIIYLTDIKNCERIPRVIQILKDNNAEILFLTSKKQLDRIEEIKQCVEKFKPSKSFIYTTPDDVAGIGSFYLFDQSLKKFFINITDHTFWIGQNVGDYFIEFRDYGASVSKKYRRIPEEKIIKLPFYPQIDRNIKFEGFPVGMDKSKRFIFSGGSLYKTLGGNGLYYKIVDYILGKYDVNFWYAGSGEKSHIDNLIKKYPNRIFLTKERKDFFQIIEKSYFYLSTYPICGGLMFQYAASAGKVPVTLKYDEDLTKGFLLEKKNLNFEFDDFDSLKEGLDKFLGDVNYVRQQEQYFKESVIEEKVFNEQLEKICKYNSNDFDIDFYDINTDRFRDEYLKRITYGDACIKLCGRKKISIFKYLPK
ncbi:MAG: hypothetical protein IJX10_08045 [Phascolarctobacterium sp.]|nr:hypothetical protein [Phascolarctobacterium sp.]